MRSLASPLNSFVAKNELLLEKGEKDGLNCLEAVDEGLEVRRVYEGVDEPTPIDASSGKEEESVEFDEGVGEGSHRQDESSSSDEATTSSTRHRRRLRRGRRMSNNFVVDVVVVVWSV